MKSVTIYCKWIGYHWAAECYVQPGETYCNQQRTHGSASQAAKEVLSQLRAKYGPAVTMRRQSMKVYHVTMLEGLK